MAFAVWQATIVDDAGNIQPNAQIQVRDEETSALVQLYQDRDGTTQLGNPITADSDGFVRFYVQSGTYRITATLGGFSREWRHVAILGHPVEPFYPRTAAEISAGVTPVDYSYPTGNIRRYGGVGDGISDDTAAFASMIASGAPELVLDEGTFLVSGTHTLSADGTRLTMHKAILKVRDETGAGAGIINLTANDCDVTLEFDFNSLGCGGITVAGDRNRVYVKGRDMQRTAQSGTSESLVKVTGSHNTIWAEGYDLTDGGIAGAVPRVVSLQGTGTHNTVMLLKGRNVVDGLVTTQTDTVISCVDLDDVTDNGLYLLSTSARVKVNGGKIRAAAEPIVITGSDIDISNVELTDCGAIGLEDATRVTIIGCSAKHLDSSLASSFIASRAGNTTSTDVTLVNCSVAINVGFGGLAQFDAGTVNNFRVYGGRYELHWTDSSNASASIVNHDAGNSVEYKDVVVRLVDDMSTPLDSADILAWEIPTISDPSLWADVYILNDTAATVRVVGLAQNSMVARSELFIRADLGPYLGGHDVSVSKTFYSSSAPTAGTWKVGDRVFNSAPAAGEQVGWVCTVAGSPGTWIPFGQMGVRSGPGSPVGAVTPFFVGEVYLRTGTTQLYMATGLTNADWLQIG